ncbi:MAG: hypothetical protein QNJ82_19325 [Gammaproteobacteria bacterium]|nr:hypothetical protein [Gammaproteobacteria bacterium]
MAVSSNRQTPTSLKLVHELWKDESDGEFTFCLAGPAGDAARALLEGKSEKIWSCEAESHFEAMTQYYKFQGWGPYSTEYPQDYWPYIDQMGNTKDPEDN